MATRDIDFRATQNILAGMKKHGVRRLVCMTSAGVGDSKQVKSFFNLLFTKLIMPLLLKKVFDAKEKQEQAFRNSDREWIIARPTWLSDGPARGTFQGDHRPDHGAGPDLPRRRRCLHGRAAHERPVPRKAPLIGG
jgi:NAD(P)H-binding